MSYRITGNREDAEDAVQDTWMKAYVRLNTFDGRAKFSTWLTRIAINSALLILRRKRAHPETSMEITDGETWQPCEIADQTKNVEDLYARLERVERLRRAICRLQPTLRNVVEIHQSNDRSVKEIADLAGISVAATKSRLLRATARLPPYRLTHSRGGRGTLLPAWLLARVRPAGSPQATLTLRRAEVFADGSTKSCREYRERDRKAREANYRGADVHFLDLPQRLVLPVAYTRLLSRD